MVLVANKEARILCRCSLADPASWAEQDAQLLGPGVDWPKLLRAGYQQAVIPLLHRYLRFHHGIISGEAPAAVSEEVHKVSQSSLVWNMQLRHQLCRLLQRFRTAEIETIVLKGIPMTELLYGDLSLRRSFDIDLLLRKDDFRKADELLRALGFELWQDVEARLKNDFHVGYRDPRTGVIVEIHWHIARSGHPGRLSDVREDLVEQWFERATRHLLGDTSCLVLHPEDMFIHLCLHFWKHRFPDRTSNFTNQAALMQLADIARLVVVCQERMDWPRILRQTEEFRTTEVMRSVIQVLELLGARLPGAARRFAGEVSDVAKLVARKILIHNQLNFPDDRRTTTLLQLVFPPLKTMAERYGLPADDRRLYFRYLTRPLELLLRHSRLFFRRSELRQNLVLRAWIDDNQDARP